MFFFSFFLFYFWMQNKRIFYFLIIAFSLCYELQICRYKLNKSHYTYYVRIIYKILVKFLFKTIFVFPETQKIIVWHKFDHILRFHKHFNNIVKQRGAYNLKKIGEHAKK
jgi:hypothetical protein